MTTEQVILHDGRGRLVAGPGPSGMVTLSWLPAKGGNHVVGPALVDDVALVTGFIASVKDPVLCLTVVDQCVTSKRQASLVWRRQEGGLRVLETFCAGCEETW